MYHRKRLKGFLLWLLLCSSLFALPFFPALLNLSSGFYGLRSTQPLPDLIGLEVAENSLAVVFLGYLHCGTVCPEQLLNLKILHDRLPDLPLRFVFISLDPERDSQQALNSTMQALGERFMALRPPSLSDAQSVALAFHDIAAVTGYGDHYDLEHRGFIYIVSDRKQIELIYTSQALDLLRVEQDLRRLLRMYPL